MDIPKPSRLHYVYTGSYPDGFLDEMGANLYGIVFYVGSSKIRYEGLVKQRMEEHEAYARNGYGAPYYEVIRKIWNNGKQVVWNIVFEADDKEDVLAMEKHMIKNVYASPHLTNVAYNLDNMETKQRKALEELEKRINAKLTQLGMLP